MTNVYLHFHFQDTEYSLSSEDVARLMAFAQRMSWAIQDNPESSVEAKALSEDFTEFANKKVQKKSIWD